MSSIVPPSGPTARWRSFVREGEWRATKGELNCVSPFPAAIDFSRRGARNRRRHEPPLHDELGAHLLRALLWRGADGDSSRRVQGGGLAVPRFHEAGGGLGRCRDEPTWADCRLLSSPWDAAAPKGKKKNPTPVALDFIWGGEEPACSAGFRGCATIEPSKWTDAVFWHLTLLMKHISPIITS